MRHHLYRPIVLLLVLVLAMPVWAENGPELPSSPAARRGFVPGPVPEKSVPASAIYRHPAEDGGAVPGVKPAVVRFSDIALPAVPVTEAPLRSHIQGEILQSQGGVDLIPTTELPAWPTETVDSSRPDIGSAFTKALGDIETGFDGLAATGWIPPDTVMAPGPSHVVEATNSGYAVYSKTGTNLVGYLTFDSFFTGVKPGGWAGFMFDPRVLYSAEHQKFCMLVLGLDQTNMTSYVFIAISQTTDPTGLWWIWAINSNYAGFTADSWLDYAGLGADTWGVYFTGNYFLWAGGYKYSTIVSLSPGMFSGGASTGWQFVNLQWPSTSLASSVQPALPLSVAGGSETFFVNSWSGFGSQLLLWTLTGDRTSSPTLNKAVVTVAAYSALGENVDQPGSAFDIDGGDSRIMNAFYAQRRVYTALTSDTNGNGSSSGAFLAKVNVDSNTAEWNTTLDGGAGWYYFFPAIVIGDPFGTSPPVSVFLSWTYPALTYYASAAARTYGGPPGNLNGPFPILATGLAPYVALDGNGRNRWGDYTGGGFDFTHLSVWGAVEYAGTSNTWRTRISELSNPIFADGFESGNTSAWSSTTP